MSSIVQDEKIGVILLNYNSYQDTLECIKSLENSIHVIFKIYVVDNNSSDDSFSRLKENLSNCFWIDSKENAGFAAGCNLGARVAVDDGCSFILFLNNDTIVERNTLSELLNCALDNRLNLGAVGGKIVYESEPKIVWDYGGRLDMLRGVGRRIGHYQQLDHTSNGVRQVDFITGCMILMPSDVFTKTGGFPECYFFGIEEWDFGIMLKKLGLRMYVTGEAMLQHKVGGAHDDYDPVFYYNYLRGRFLFMRRNVGLVYFVLWALIMSIYLTFIKPIIYFRLYSKNKELYKASFIAVRHSVKYKDYAQSIRGC